MKGIRIALVSTFLTIAQAQTYSTCNPLHQQCAPNPALGGTCNADFTKGASSMFTPLGSSSRIGYSGDGVGLSVVGRGDSPTLQSNFYFMFGRADVVMKAAPGVGIVSSIVLESDDLDEVDWEFLGGDITQVQSNYFGKGDTTTYNRGAFHNLAFQPQTNYATYSVVWTSTSVSWLINGATVRTLTAEQGGYNYPQTPMRLKIGIWAGGDSGNQPGTIQWAGGQTTYTDAGYTMFVKSATVEDYSTGKTYSYSDNTGSWQSIRSDGGTIYGGAEPRSGGTPTKPQPGSSVTISSAPQPLTPLQSTFMTLTSVGAIHTGWPWDGTASHETQKGHHTSVSSADSELYASLAPGKQPVNAGVSVTGSGDASSQPTSSPSDSSSPSSASSSASASPSGHKNSAVAIRSVSKSMPIFVTCVIGLLCIL